MTAKKACKVRGCKATELDKPSIFRGQDYCCENHRKILERNASGRIPVRDVIGKKK